jgi:hypothetical protein
LSVFLLLLLFGRSFAIPYPPSRFGLAGVIPQFFLLISDKNNIPADTLDISRYGASSLKSWRREYRNLPLREANASIFYSSPYCLSSMINEIHFFELCPNFFSCLGNMNTDTKRRTVEDSRGLFNRESLSIAK